MNVLLTSVGRRAYMVKYFKNAVGDEGQVHVSNSDGRTSAFCYADKGTISPLIYSNEYIPFLLDYCVQNQIAAIVSLFDIDLFVLSQNQKRFLEIGTQVIVSNPELISVCNDKWKTYQYLITNGFHAPKTYLSMQSVQQAIQQGELCYPIIVKPRFGCGSIAVSVAEDETDLVYLQRKSVNLVDKSYLRFESAKTTEKVVFQECLCGQEYGADIMNDLNGTFQYVNIRKKLAMRSGETDIAELVNHPTIQSELTRLGQTTHHIANMDVDLFLISGVPYILEMNARFGGGYPFSHVGGCNLPLAIVQWLKGGRVPLELLTTQVGITLYKELIVTKNA